MPRAVWSLREKWQTQTFLIAPAIAVSRMSAKDQQERAIQAGYEAARAALARIVITK